MKQKFISKSLVFLVIISCSATNENSENNQDIYIESTTKSSSLVEDIMASSTTTIIPTQLDKTYRNGKNFTLPTFNGNCPHEPDEILNLFNYWIQEFDLNISFDIVGEPVFGSGSKLQLEKCINKIIGSNLNQNVNLLGSEHIEIIVGRKFEKEKIETKKVDLLTNDYVKLDTYGPISFAQHPVSSDFDLLSDIFGNIFLKKNSKKIYTEENVTVKDNGGFLSLKYLNNENYLLGFYTYNQKIFIDLYFFDETDSSLIKLKNVKKYSFPEYYSCNKTTLLTSVFTHCKSSGSQSTYIGHAGGGMEINNDDIFIGLGDTNIASSVFNSTYTTRNSSLPWGKILRFKFDYDNLELIGNGNHKDSLLNEVWITGVRNPYRFSINGNSMWIADLGTYIEDEINFVSLNDNNIDLGWPFYEGAFSHQPFPYYSNDKTSFKAPIFSERIGGLIGGHILKVEGKNIYIYGTLDGKLFGLEIQNNGVLKVEFNLPEFDFGDGNILLSIEKSRLGILLMSSDGLITEIKNS